MSEEDSIGGEVKLEQLNILWIIQGEWWLPLSYYCTNKFAVLSALKINNTKLIANHYFTIRLVVFVKNQSKKKVRHKMITLNKYADSPNRAWMELYGLSTDEKPIKKFGTTYIGNASTYYEMDSKKLFIYDEENHQWLEM